MSCTSSSSFRSPVESVAGHGTSSPTTVSSTPNQSPARTWLPQAPAVSLPPGIPGTPFPHASPVLAQSAPSYSNVSFPSSDQDTCCTPSTPFRLQTVSMPAHTASFSTTVSSAPNQSPARTWLPQAPAASLPPGIPGTPFLHAPPVLAQSAPSYSNLTFPSSDQDTSCTSSTSFRSQTVSMLAHTTSSSTTVSSAPNQSPARTWLPQAPAASLPPGIPGTPFLHALPVPAQSAPSYSNLTFPSSGQDTSCISSTCFRSQPASIPAHTTCSSTTVSSAPNGSPARSWTPQTPSIPMPPGIPGTPMPHGPPMVTQSAPSYSNIAFSSSAVCSVSSSSLSSSCSSSSSFSILKPATPTAAFPTNIAIQQQVYPVYPSLTSITPQGPWLPPQQIGTMPLPSLLPYPSFAGLLPPSAQGLPLPFVPVPDSQPPGVTPIGVASVTQMNLMEGGSGIQQLLPASEHSQHANDGGTKHGAAHNEYLDAWTAHKTEAGLVYYYNALTRESTYERPHGFKGEPDKVIVQPIPVSWENLAGTDWALVTTNDGKKYYYNTKTKSSSWQIPSDVSELRRKQDNDPSKEHSAFTPNSIVLAEKGAALSCLDAPALNTGGRDAITLRPAVVSGSSSALDLIKKKLQDSGAPVASSSIVASSGVACQEIDVSKAVDVAVKGMQSENSKDKLKDTKGDGNISDSSSDSEDEDSGPTKEQCVGHFREMLKERGVAPFSKWEKELPKLVFDPRFKAIPSHSARRSLFEHYVKTRAEEERKEKRAAQKAAVEGFKNLLDEATEDIDHNTDYHAFKKRRGNDPRFGALDRKDREQLLNERVLPLKKAADKKVQAIRDAAASSFKSMLQEKGYITTSIRWSRVKDSLRNDSRYKSVKHEEREVLFNEYISELKSAQEEALRDDKARRDEQEKLREREREFRKRKEREEEEMERVRSKIRRKEAISSYQALLVEIIKDPQASWTESKPKLEKDPQGRATNSDLTPSDMEKLFREHVKLLYERCLQDFQSLLAEVLTAEVAPKETQDGKTFLNSWSTAKHCLKSDTRFTRMPRKERESLWRRYVEDIQRKHKSADDQTEKKPARIKR